MYRITFCTSDSHALVCERHSDPEALEYTLELADFEETNETGDCLICWDPVFSDLYERQVALLNDDVLVAIYNIACDWHGGQWSRGYRLLCHARRLLERRGIDLETTPDPGYLAGWGERLRHIRNF